MSAIARKDLRQRDQTTDRPAELPLGVRRAAAVRRAEIALIQDAGLDRGAAVVLGLSGGVDSSALLLILAVLRQRGVVHPIAVHVHHHLRQADADEDATFAGALAGRFDIPFEHRDAFPVAGGQGIASAARTARYDALADAARGAGATAVVVAHHAGDQAETRLMALARGTGITGLAGMPLQRALTADVQLVRPLLDCTRAELATICQAAGVEPREDPTNRDPSSPRARIRHEVVPILESIWPGAACRAGRTEDRLRTLLELEQELLEKHFGPPAQRRWARRTLAELPRTLVASGLRRAALAFVPGVTDALGTADLDRAARLVTGSNPHPRRLDWPRGLVLHVTAETVSLERTRP